MDQEGLVRAVSAEEINDRLAEVGPGQWDMQVQWLDTGHVHPNPANPNQQDDATFNDLVKSIEQDGWTSPAQVVEIAVGEFEIVAGEHRWRAAKVLGSRLPAIVLPAEQYHEDRRAWALVKDNQLHGVLNPEKFAKLYNDLKQRYSGDVLRTLMGFTSEDAFRKVYKEARDGLSPEMQKALDASKEEIKTIDDLSNVLNRLFAEFGSTLPSNMMVFSHSGRDVLWVRTDHQLWRLVKARAEDAASKGLDFAEEVKLALLEVWGSTTAESVDNPADDTGEKPPADLPLGA